MKKLITVVLCVALVSTTIISATAESQSTLTSSIEPVVNVISKYVTNKIRSFY